MLVRLPDWRTRLHAYLASCANRPFEWGTWDCVTHAADAVEAMTGQIVASDVRGGYKTELGAKRKLTALGYANVVELAGAYLPIATRAREGDIVAVGSPFGLALAVMGRGVAMGCHPEIGLWPVYDRPVASFEVPFP